MAAGEEGAGALEFMDSPFLQACRRERTPYTPIWIMRQAGRYLPSYRRLRKKVPFKTLCRRPDLASEAAVSAAEEIGADAAIVFSDILLLLEPMGFPVDYRDGVGPVLTRRIRTPRDLARLRAPEAGDLGYVYDAVKATRRGLPARLPLIGFAGGPFTLAVYLIDGGARRGFRETKAFMYRHPAVWRRLMTTLSRAAAGHLARQARAGADALQLFDTWVGCLSPADYRAHVLPYMKALFRRLPAGLPAIHFGTGTASLLEPMREAGGSVMGLDSTVDLGAAWDRLPGACVMGNLDPCVLLAKRPLIRREARRILSAARGRPGHVFNLGHGVLPQTPVGNVRALVDAVHEASGVMEAR